MSVPAGNPSNLKNFWTVTNNKSLYVLKWDTGNEKWFYLKCGKLIAVNFSKTYQDTEAIKYIVFKLTVECEQKIEESEDMDAAVDASFDLPPIKTCFVVQEHMFTAFGDGVVKDCAYLQTHPKSDMVLCGQFRRGTKKSTGNWLKHWMQSSAQCEEPSFAGPTTPTRNTKTNSSTLGRGGGSSSSSGSLGSQGDSVFGPTAAADLGGDSDQGGSAVDLLVSQSKYFFFDFMDLCICIYYVFTCM